VKFQTPNPKGQTPNPKFQGNPKLQTPNPRSQGSPKLQFSNSKAQRPISAEALAGSSLGIEVSLGFGTWDLEFHRGLLMLWLVRHWGLEFIWNLAF
jgi:hypothetical protein